MRLAVGMLVSFLLCGRLAQAKEQEPQVDPRANEARTACMAGEVQKGVRLLAELYTASDDPIWIFNQGRCYQQNAQPALGVSRFKEFLRKSKAGPDDEDVRDAQKYIAELETELQAKGADPGRGTAPATPQVERVPQSDGTAPVSLTTVPESPSSSPPIYKRWWFWAGVGAVVVAGTITALLVARGSDSSPCSGIGPNCVELK
jgi:hypothetical protein